MLSYLETVNTKYERLIYGNQAQSSAQEKKSGLGLFKGKKKPVETVEEEKSPIEQVDTQLAHSLEWDTEYYNQQVSAFEVVSQILI